jgi:dTDP-4-amino-4,6-dideoxygalactose transaminase
MTCATDASRIGGEFEIELDFLLRSPNQQEPSQALPYGLWTDTGSSALLLAATDILQLGGAPVVWLPAFCCESVTRTFQQAGFTPRYYSSDELHGEAGAEPKPERGETVLIVHYFGHYNRRRARAAESWRRDGVFVVEDAVQALLSGGVGRIGHYAVTSFRKFLPQPDGALLGSHRPLKASLASADERFVSARVLGKLLRGAQAPAASFLPLFHESEALYAAATIVPREPSWLGRQLLARSDLAAIAAKRRHNHHALHRMLTERAARALSPLLGTLADDEVPLGLPVRIRAGRRDALRRHLAAHSVFCAVHWPLPQVPADAGYAADHLLASDILTLPIDQRMDAAHLERLVSLVEYFVTETQ